MALLFTIRDANDHSQGYCFLFAAVCNLCVQDARCWSANLVQSIFMLLLLISFLTPRPSSH